MQKPTLDLDRRLQRLTEVLSHTPLIPEGF
jgi:hypothetical protein